MTLMPKKFTIKQRLDRKYNGENKPIIIRQGDMGTLIECQIFSEDNNPYDLTNCTVTFTLQGASGLPVLDEPCSIIDTINGFVRHAITQKDSRYAGKVKHAFFRISKANEGLIESTGDIDIIILEMPTITPDDYHKIISNFKGKTKGDLTNPNMIGLTFESENQRDKIFTVKQTEVRQEVYDAFNDPKLTEMYMDSMDLCSGIIYNFKIDSRATKVQINNISYKSTDFKKYLFGQTGLDNIKRPFDSILDCQRQCAESDAEQKFYNQPLLTPKFKLGLYNQSNIKGVTGLKFDSYGYMTSFELDLTTTNYLTSDNYLLIHVKSSESTESKTIQPTFPFILSGTSIKRALLFCTQIECIQYYLPE